jgi:hypothetical protein
MPRIAAGRDASQDDVAGAWPGKKTPAAAGTKNKVDRPPSRSQTLRKLYLM